MRRTYFSFHGWKRTEHLFPLGTCVLSPRRKRSVISYFTLKWFLGSWMLCHDPEKLVLDARESLLLVVVRLRKKWEIFNWTLGIRIHGIKNAKLKHQIFDFFTSWLEVLTRSLQRAAEWPTQTYNCHFRCTENDSCLLIPAFISGTRYRIDSLQRLCSAFFTQVSKMTCLVCKIFFSRHTKRSIKYVI